MKYKELIQFDPIDEIIKFGKLDDEDYRAKLVRNFVCLNSANFQKFLRKSVIS